MGLRMAHQPLVGWASQPLRAHAAGVRGKAKSPKGEGFPSGGGILLGVGLEFDSLSSPLRPTPRGSPRGVGPSPPSYIY